MTDDDAQRLERRMKREREARKQAEQLLEHKSLELYQANQQLRDAAENLEGIVKSRTDALRDALTQAEAATRAKSEFLAVMSHEIRTPLNGVLATAELMETTDLDSEQLEYLKIIRRSGDALLVLINDILDFSKIEAGHLELDPHAIDLSAELQSILDLYSQIARDKGIELVLKTADLPQALMIDSVRLRQVITNLVSNAIKFTHTGSVTLAVDAKTASDGRFAISVTVRDTGIGIPPDRIDRLFKVFSQADSSTTRQYGGTGLGLVISARLVEAMGGKISVSSTAGAGTCFSFTIEFEVATGPPEMKAAETGIAAHDASLRILLAEDHQTNQIIAMRMLKKLGFEADLAVNGKEAVEMAQKGRYDIIFMDMQMPEMDGVEATSEIRKLPLPHQPRIIAVTANAFSSDREQCLAVGMNDFLTKPYKIDHFRDILQAA